MHLFTFFWVCLTLSITSIATPASPKSTKVTTTSYSYLLQTHVLHGGRKDFDGLYVTASHTGAGTNAAILVKNKNAAVRGQLYKGAQYFDLGDYPSTFDLPDATTYDAWYPVFINGGVYTSDLFLNSTGLQWTDDHSFGGWLVCKWSRGVPQLFWKVQYYPYPYPSSVCAEVDIRPAEKGKTFKIKGI